MRFQNMFPDLQRDTYDAFWEANAGSTRLTLRSEGDVPVRLVEWSDLLAVMRQAGDISRLADRQDLYATAYPPSKVIALSGVGVAADGGQALIYVHDHSGGSGAYYLLVARQNRWDIVSEFVVWQE
jgi:hypothetical protein